jgi:outer membrane lipoprotein SlyB
MRKRFLTAVLSAGLLFSTATPGMAITHRYHRRVSARYVRHRRHMKTAKRIGIGAAGGAAVGALAGGGKGAGIGALVGAGAGALYDRHEKHHGHY